MKTLVTAAAIAFSTLVAMSLVVAQPAATGPARPAAMTVVSINPEGIMDTDVELTAIVYEGREEKGQEAVQAAEAALRAVETKMSSHLADAEISAINKADVGREVPLSSEVVEVLKAAREYTKSTGGVFDVTIRPLLQLWKRAGMAKRLPTGAEIKSAQALVGWDNFKLTDKGITKLRDGSSIDLGGIAKKWAIDKAAKAMNQEGVLGGLVNVGGDLRVFGERKGYGKWQVGITNPFDKDSMIASMSVKDSAVCTSGNYERFVVIDGKRYSHIVDPRNGQPADAVPSVTVYGKTAVEAGVWATSLSILGPNGLKLMPRDSGLEAMLITGGQTNYKFHYTPGFKKLLNELPAEPLPPLTRAATASATAPRP